MGAGTQDDLRRNLARVEFFLRPLQTLPVR